MYNVRSQDYEAGLSAEKIGQGKGGWAYYSLNEEMRDFIEFCMQDESFREEWDWIHEKRMRVLAGENGEKAG